MGKDTGRIARRWLVASAAVVGLALAGMLPAVAAAAAADLSVTKADSPDVSVTAGSNLTYTIAVSNGGTDAAADVALSDSTPASTTFVSFTAPDGWTCTTPASGGTGAISCTNPSLAAAASAVFTLVVNVDAGTPEGTEISNTASVTTTTEDSNTANDTATATTTVGLALDLCTITGTNKADDLVGTDGDDVICAGNGKDHVDAGAGNDIVVGGNGKDHLIGGEGNDSLLGRNGKDELVGDAGLDVLAGGNGKDLLDGDDDAAGDTLDGGKGKDTCVVDEGDVSTDC
jgi:uncharacterized repeat protein (TIGR01451 family)